MLGSASIRLLDRPSKTTLNIVKYSYLSLISQFVDSILIRFFLYEIRPSRCQLNIPKTPILQFKLEVCINS